ncbi:hypothetical protein [Bacillus massilinigeriensis]|uniref:hypothetical protein n=1 Tax=Bacillus mediterraneensis TaxID=1805474 RepID=UPI0008F85A22|nr:hypothetical protein [Bacillus mediterraneensis]
MQVSYFRLLCWIFTACVAAVTVIAFNKQDAKETFTFFPPDPAATYTSADTSLSLAKISASESYAVEWKAFSTLNQKAYLRQDISLLFKNGRLTDGMGKWKTNAETLYQLKNLKENENALYEAITFHYSEIHRNDDTISSAQKLTNDTLYVLISPSTNAIGFQTPSSAEEKEWQSILNRAVGLVSSSTVRKAAASLNIEPQNYESIALTGLPAYRDQTFPGLNKRQTRDAIGRLWEGIYKNYYLGIKKQNGTIVSPVGSTVPIILLSKTGNVLYLVFETKDGELIYLKQLTG